MKDTLFQQHRWCIEKLITHDKNSKSSTYAKKIIIPGFPERQEDGWYGADNLTIIWYDVTGLRKELLSLAHPDTQGDIVIAMLDENGAVAERMIFSNCAFKKLNKQVLNYASKPKIMKLSAEFSWETINID